MSHYYDPDTGKPQFQILNAKQTKEQGKNVYRQTTARDAKKHGWKPGWTAIGGILDKPQLNAWKKGIFKGVIDEHLSKHDSETVGERNDRLVMETRAEFWRRIESETRHELEKYAELGTEVHREIEKWLKWETTGIAATYRTDTADCLHGFGQWYEQHVKGVIASEQTFCSPEWGYGGTIDLEYLTKASQDAIVDFKTKQTKPGEKIVQYPENKWQLVAYALGIEKIRWGDKDNLPLAPGQADDAWCCKPSFPILGNLYLSTTEPGRWEYAAVDPKEIPELILDVRDLTRLWNRIHGF